LLKEYWQHNTKILKNRFWAIFAKIQTPFARP
jgi:hypothetical protein